MFEKNGKSVSSVARNIGAERTSIHKAMVGERILPYNVVHSLASYFQLSVEERREFFRLYDIMLQGEDVWQNREAVASLINYLSTIQFQELPAPVSVTADAPAYDDATIQWEFAVLNMLNSVLYHEIISNEHPALYLFLPPNMDLSPLFINRWLRGNQFDVEQMFCISSIGSSSAENVGLLKQVIPMSLISRDSYSPLGHFTAASMFRKNPFVRHSRISFSLCLAAKWYTQRKIHSECWTKALNG